MHINYVSNNTGDTIAIQIPISDWIKIKNKYPDVDDIDSDLPQWQKNMIDKRLKVIEDDPESIEDIEGLFEELDREII